MFICNCQQIKYLGNFIDFNIIADCFEFINSVIASTVQIMCRVFHVNTDTSHTTQDKTIHNNKQKQFIG